MKSVIVFLAGMLCATAAPAQSPYQSQPLQVGIPTASFNFVAAAQQMDEWCWAASVEMILRWYRIPVSQQMVVLRTHHVLLDQPGSDADISSALTGWATTVSNQTATIPSWVAAGPPAPDVLVSELSRGHPILLTFATGAYSLHRSGSAFLYSFSA